MQAEPTERACYHVQINGMNAIKAFTGCRKRNPTYEIMQYNRLEMVFSVWYSEKEFSLFPDRSGLLYSKIRKYVHISMNNQPDTLSLARFPNLANVKVIADFTIIYPKVSF